MEGVCAAALLTCKCLCVTPLAGLDPRGARGSSEECRLVLCMFDRRFAPVCLLSEVLLDSFVSGRSSSSRRRGGASLASTIRGAPNCIWVLSS